MEGFTIGDKLQAIFSPVLPLVFDDSLSYYEAIGKLVQQVNQFSEILNQHSKAIEEYADINGKQYNEFVKQVGTMFSQVQAKVTSTYDDLLSEEERIENLELQVADIHNHLSEILEKINKLPDDFESIMERLVAVEQKAAANETNINNIISGTTTVGHAANADLAVNSEQLSGIPGDNYALKTDIPASIVVDDELSDTSQNPVENLVITAALDAIEKRIAELELGGGGEAVPIDTELSETSTNPVENRAITLGIAEALRTATERVIKLQGDLENGTIAVGNSQAVGGVAADNVVNKEYLEERLAELPSSGTVDTALSWTSGNPVANYEVSGALIWLDSEIQELRKQVEQGGTGGDIVVDDVLSNTSINPVQNKVITAALDTMDEVVQELKQKVDNLPEEPGTVTVDKALSWESQNPVANYEVSAALIWLDNEVQKIKLQLEEGGGGGGSIVVDQTLNASSTNAVANKAVTDAIDNLEVDKVGFNDVDSVLSETSTNPIQNMAVEQQFSVQHQHIEEVNTALISAMASFADGTTTVGNAAKVGGKTASEIMTGINVDIQPCTYFTGFTDNTDIIQNTVNNKLQFISLDRTLNSTNLEISPALTGILKSLYGLAIFDDSSVAQVYFSTTTKKITFGTGFKTTIPKNHVIIYLMLLLEDENE